MAHIEDRAGSDSRVCKPWDAPYVWRDYTDHTAEGVVEIERWLASLPPFVRHDIEGRLDELFQAASEGRLEDSGDAATPIKPIHRDPEIFELRTTQLTKKLRFYHGEPDFLPAVLVALNQHIKTGGRAQQAEINAAARRYSRGRSRSWE